MKKALLFTSLWMIPLMAFAQPVEEVIDSEDTPVYEIEVIESPADLGQPEAVEPVTPLGQAVTPTTQNQAVKPLQQAQTIGEVAAVDEVAPAKEEVASTWNFSPSLTVQPLFYNKFSNKGTTGRVAPSASISTDFAMGGGRKIGFSLGYLFGWDEFFNKSKGMDRALEHDTSLGLSFDISDTWSGSLGVGLNYSFAVSPGSTTSASYWSGNALTFSNKVNDDLTFTLGYGLDLYNAPSGKIFASAQGLPSDLEDIRQGNFGFDPDSGGASSDDIVLSNNTYFMNNVLKLATNYKVPKGPSLKFAYDMTFLTLTNNASSDWRGHALTIQASQGAWEGGTLILKNHFRMQNFQSTTIGSGAKKRGYRNRTDLMISQGITDNISMLAWYRLQLTSSNDTSEWKPQHQMFIQTALSF